MRLPTEETMRSMMFSKWPRSESAVCELQLTVTFHVDFTAAIDKDVGYARFEQQRLYRAKPKNLVFYALARIAGSRR